ncbi:di-trans,poly-cis-decaprenylcistransferase [Candidatus Roizmanbacteria bacterium]|nr:MAG: di-trans,poly-cis-decaprenylcistransferase [Candidatus Roizmanbacteria bacterium]
MHQSELKHVAIIPDGNRRWARSKGKPSIEGHRYAVEHTLPDLFDAVQELGIEYCTVWLLSPENFTKRTQEEVSNLLWLLKLFLKKRIEELDRKNVRMRIIGDIANLPADTQKELEAAIERTKTNTGTVVTFAINYGGRDELVRAIRNIVREHVDQESITKEYISNRIDTKDLPDPDLVIRTGGDKRTSGFMLWQAEYAEYAFVDKLFPDFTPADLKQCVEDFLHRQRRFGK